MPVQYPGRMTLLHIETSTHRGSAAITHDDRLVAYRQLPADQPQSATLAPAIRAMLDECGLRPANLSAISVSAGPGSYTGLRVGSSTAKAMAYSLGLPLVDIPTLYALAWRARVSWPDAAFYLPLIDARRTEVYAVLFDHALEPAGPVMSVCLDDPAFYSLLPPSGHIIACGDGCLKIPLDLEERTGLRIDRTLVQDATLLPGPAAERLAAGRTADPIHFVPDYLKPPNITTPKNR